MPRHRTTALIITLIAALAVVTTALGVDPLRDVLAPEITWIHGHLS